MEAVKFNPEIELSDEARVQVAHTTAQPGFVYINRIMRAEVDKFVIELIKTDEKDDKAVLAAHKLSKAAAFFYQRVVDRINYEVKMARGSLELPTGPTDPTEEGIDLGPRASIAEDLDPDLLDGFTLNEQLVEEELG